MSSDRRSARLVGYQLFNDNSWQIVLLWNIGGEFELIFNSRRTTARFKSGLANSRQQRWRSEALPHAVRCHVIRLYDPSLVSSQLVVCAHFKPCFVMLTARCCSCIVLSTNMHWWLIDFRRPCYFFSPSMLYPSCNWDDAVSHTIHQSVCFHRRSTEAGTHPSMQWASGSNMSTCCMCN